MEDDAQDGGDHVDSHRTTAYVAGAYVKNALVSTAYNTLDFVRTMEEVLGLPPMNLNDALANPMSDIFNPTPKTWSFTATPASILYCTNLPLPQPAQPCQNPTPDANYWARVTQRHGLHGRRPCGWRRLQSHSLERADGRQALSRRANRKGPAPEPGEIARRLSQVSAAGVDTGDSASGRKTSDRYGLKPPRAASRFRAAAPAGCGYFACGISSMLIPEVTF